MISIHWIPTHRGDLSGTSDAEYFARWKPSYVKIVCIDEKPPYTEDVPASAKIVIRNHPMSELYGSRGLAAAELAENPYEGYFASVPDNRYAGMGRPGTWQSRSFTNLGAPTASSPENTGTEHASTCKRMADYLAAKGVLTSRLLFEGLNEPQLWANEPPELTARYYKAFLVGLHSHGLHGVVGNFGVGWPGNGGVQDAPVQWDFFKPVIDVLEAGDYLGLHEYWALNGPGQNWRWWGGRFLQCPYKVPILITECGIDTGVTGRWYGGWRDLPESSNDAKATRYVDELWWYAKQCAADGRVQGVFPFTYDIGSEEWEKFDIRDTVFLGAFFKKLAAEGMPMPTPTDPANAIRNAAWRQLGIPYNPDAAFSQKARELNLGSPVTSEFDANGYRAQGFAGAILWCVIGEWNNIKTLNW